MDSLPRLAVGSHPAGSGKACIMNAISMINGDTIITDMPSCTHPLLARFAQGLNDKICDHRDGKFLCPDCTHKMWMFGTRLIGTSEATVGWTPYQEWELAVTLARFAADRVAHLRGKYAAAADAAYAYAYADVAAAYAADAAAAAADAASQARLDLYTSLVDEFYRLTGYSQDRQEFSEQEISVVRESVEAR